MPSPLNPSPDAESRSTRPKVVLSEHLSDQARQWLTRHCQVVASPHDAPGFVKTLSDADGLIVRTYTRVDEQLLQAAPKLRVVARAGAGLDNIDVPACRRRGIEVVYAPDANTQAVVEYVLCLLGDALRPRITLDRAVDAQRWSDLRQQTVGRRQLDQLTLGILGLGRVGRKLASVAAAVGMNVLYNDLVDIPTERRSGASPVTAEALFEAADVISIHIDGRQSNRHFVSRLLLARMKDDVVFINTSRGFVVDAAALADFLTDHPHAQAMLDVHEPEPFSQDYPLLGLPNAKLYPHLASRTVQAMDNMSWVVRDVVAVLQARQPQHPAPAD